MFIFVCFCGCCVLVLLLKKLFIMFIRGLFCCGLMILKYIFVMDLSVFVYIFVLLICVVYFVIRFLKVLGVLCCMVRRSRLRKLSSGRLGNMWMLVLFVEMFCMERFGFEVVSVDVKVWQLVVVVWILLIIRQGRMVWVVQSGVVCGLDFLYYLYFIFVRILGEFFVLRRR